MTQNTTSPMQLAGEALCSRFATLSREELERKPAPDAWSRRQVVEHMMLAYDGTARELERRREKGGPSSRPRTLQNRVGQFVVVRLGRFPAGRKAPAMVDPAVHDDLPPMDGPQLAAEYRRSIAATEQAIAQAEAAWGRVAIATHPVLGPLDSSQWRRFHAVHTLHHVGQMDRIARALAG